MIPPKRIDTEKLSQKERVGIEIGFMKKLQIFDYEQLKNAIFNNGLPIENIDDILENLEVDLKHLLTQGLIFEVKPKIYKAVI